MATSKRSRSQASIQRDNQNPSVAAGSTTPKPSNQRGTQSKGSQLHPVQKLNQTAHSRTTQRSGMNQNDTENSYVSADEADQPRMIKKPRVSSVFEYAEKTSDHDYYCQICKKVRMLFLY